MNKIHTEASLLQQFRACGIEEGSTLLIHSSMKSFGEVEGGAETVINALMKAVTERGLLLFPAFSYSFVTDDQPVFCLETTPCCTGILPELFRQRSDVKRSNHPFHSLAAWGEGASEFVKGHEQHQTSFDRRSPWGRFFDRKGKVFFAGVKLDRATFIHAVEEWCHVPVLSEEPVIRYVFSNGTKIPMKIHWHTGAHSENYPRAERMLLECGALKKCRVGDADSMLMDSVKTFECLEKTLRSDPQFFTH